MTLDGFMAWNFWQYQHKCHINSPWFEKQSNRVYVHHFYDDFGSCDNSKIIYMEHCSMEKVLLNSLNWEHNFLTLSPKSIKSTQTDTKNRKSHACWNLSTPCQRYSKWIELCKRTTRKARDLSSFAHYCSIKVIFRVWCSFEENFDYFAADQRDHIHIHLDAFE